MSPPPAPQGYSLCCMGGWGYILAVSSTSSSRPVIPPVSCVHTAAPPHPPPLNGNLILLQVC
uniref:Uncharacterized protein n=1 Tax=Anguilla anguilla TaxID=7936 RepID=A0A0E9QIP6_ANGAN